MYICRILLIQLLGCHTEINACLILSSQTVTSNSSLTATVTIQKARTTNNKDMLTKLKLKSGILIQRVSPAALYNRRSGS